MREGNFFSITVQGATDKISAMSALMMGMTDDVDLTRNEVNVSAQ